MADSGVAKKRWQILAAAIKRAANKTAEDTDGAASVRRFTTFGLVHQQSVGPDSKALDDLKSALSPEELESASDFYFHGESWAQYRCDGAAKPVYVYDRKEAVTLEEMMGFNNTGNVCIWPSEEILAVYCLEHLEEFQKKSVMELGCGKGPLAGLMVAVNCDTVQRVVFTDGNEQSVANVKTSLPMNKANLGTTHVEASTLAWDRELDLSHFTSTPFDLIICADCFFFDAVREDLLLLMHKLLAPKVSTGEPCRWGL